MQERLHYQPSSEESSKRPKTEPSFFREISSQFHLGEYPELSLTAKILSRMRGISHQEKKAVFLYWICQKDSQQLQVFGVGENDVSKSTKAVQESSFLKFTYDALEHFMETQNHEGVYGIPPKSFEIKSAYFESLLTPYLTKEGPDGKPLPYKGIAFQMSQALKSSVTISMVRHHASLMQADGRAKKRYRDSEYLRGLMGQVEKLRQTNPQLTKAEIAKLLNRPREEIERAVKYLNKKARRAKNQANSLNKLVVLF